MGGPRCLATQAVWGALAAEVGSSRGGGNYYYYCSSVSSSMFSGAASACACHCVTAQRERRIARRTPVMDMIYNKLLVNDRAR